MIQAHCDVRDAQHIAQVDQHPRHVEFGSSLQDVLQERRLAESAGGMKHGVVAAAGQSQELLALLPRNAFLGKQRTGIDERVRAMWENV